MSSTLDEGTLGFNYPQSTNHKGFMNKNHLIVRQFRNLEMYGIIELSNLCRAEV
ncbi:MAG: hypothetical protein WBL44_16905 [Nitrososphaeraceae archaeon]